MITARVRPPAIVAGLLLPGGATYAAASPSHAPSELLFIAQITCLLIVGRLLGEAMLRLKQPAVIGQLIAGLLLGPSLFGYLLPDLQHTLFPNNVEQKAMLDAIAQFGMLLLLLLTGMETDLKLVRQSGRAALYASLLGIVVPFGCGVALGGLLPDSMLPNSHERLVTALFLGTALSMASVQIVATVVRDMKFLRRTVGQVILASAIISDSIGWIIISVVFALAAQGEVDGWSLAQGAIGTLAFMAVSLTVGRRAVFFIIRWVNDTFVSDFAVITAILVIMTGMAMITQLIGVHSVLGAFVAGILVGESPILTRHIDEELRGLIVAFFMPVFFGTAGLNADLTMLGNPSLLLLTLGLIAIASLGKFGGAFAGGKLGGLTMRESLALGTGMNARGSTEVIVATIGLSLGALSQDLFTMIVAMALITTTAMPPTLRWALARLPLRKDEKQRLEREEIEARGFVPKLERLLLAVDDSANGKFAARIAGLIAGTQAMPTTVIQIKTDKKRGKAAALAEQEKANIAGETVKVFAEKVGRAQAPEEKPGARLEITAVVKTSPKHKIVAVEAEKGYDLLLVGLDKIVARRNEFHNDVTQLATDFEGPLAIIDARNLHREMPLRGALSILVPVNGTEMSRRAAEVAIAIARASRAPLTALYVASRSEDGKKRSRAYEEAILKDIVTLAEAYATELRTSVRADVAPEDAIIKEMACGKQNLVVMGVGRRPGEKLFFGDTASALLAKSDSSLLLIAS